MIHGRHCLARCRLLRLHGPKSLFHYQSKKSMYPFFIPKKSLAEAIGLEEESSGIE